MIWFQKNRVLGSFLAGFGAATLVCLLFLWIARSRCVDARTEFDRQATELATLQRHNPFPNEANLRKMKTQAEEYGVALEALKTDLKARTLPAAAMAPNEFQTRLNQARAAFAEKARANKVKLPENFFLGFDEFAGALPDTEAAPLLGQELAQVEMLLNLLIDARVDEIVSFRRVPPVRPAATPTPAPRGGKKPASAAAPSVPTVERNVVEVAFNAAPGQTRRVLNQIATAPQQFYITRSLQILNEKETGPAREGEGATAAASTPAPAAVPGASPGASPALSFIVGNEHLRTTARIEMARFTF